MTVGLDLKTLFQYLNPTDSWIRCFVSCKVVEEVPVLQDYVKRIIINIILFNKILKMMLLILKSK